jgi:LysM repeat protein
MNHKFKNIFSDSYIFYSKRIVLGLFLFVISFPVVTEASFMTSVTSFFTGESVSAQAETYIETNSQTMDLLEPSNNMNPTIKLNLGTIAGSGEALSAEVGPSGENFQKTEYTNDQISTYVVREGDSLGKIAEMYDVSINTILWANDMNRNSVIRPGQNLVILPMSGVLHTVSSGDTLSIIAKKYSGDIDEIAIFNDLKSTDKLSIGDIIIIPDGQASSSISPSSVNNSSTKIVSNNTSYKGYYIKPFASGRKTQGIHGYNAVDYGMPVGTALYASAEGTVIIAKNAGWNGGYGQYVVIKHPNNTQTLYAHMSRVSVSVGQTVKKGQTIGLSGNTGRSTGPHLHFEIRGAKNPF